MESRSNYRILIDLSNYYDDARRLSCVFTDDKTISHIIHLKQRISKVFKIPGEFYLVAGQEVYLPLNEDIRIIKENEIIQVVPGSGVEGFLLWKDLTVRHDGNPLEALPVKQTAENINLRIDNNQETKLIQQKNSLQIVESLKLNLQQSHIDNNEKLINDIANKTNDQSITNNQNESSGISSIPRRKRKRIRKRKPKKTIEQFTTNSIKEIIQKPIEFNSIKPISKPKHMKFNWDDINDEITNKNNDDTSSLSNLLNLKNTPIPVIFEGKKTNNFDKLKIEKCENIHGFDNNGDKNLDYNKINPQNYPIHKAELLVDDVIAFRVFKLENDYTPGVSGNIIAKILNADKDKQSYKLSIITGGDQLKEPEGKFSLENNDLEMDVGNETTSIQSEIIEKKSTELIEPRLIFRA
ncbi:hypothetical protein HCN44_007140 [Aphidius gifuensis]|uniref:Coilin N-terminal domain-containing protein n=1 Tax=Aphidius gifuensis TaxID=684658 RepID=A0A834XKX8_APHGI|nr:hypothetical protein HCN44_007140 [Aphidius gifuensis]